MANWKNPVCLSCEHSWIEIYPDGDEIKCHLECLTKGKTDKETIKDIQMTGHNTKTEGGE